MSKQRKEGREKRKKNKEKERKRKRKRRKGACALHGGVFVPSV
jgi:hypothetical protein